MCKVFPQQPVTVRFDTPSVIFEPSRLFVLSYVSAHMPGGHSEVFKCKLVARASATRPRAFLHTHGDVRFYGERERELRP